MGNATPMPAGGRTRRLWKHQHPPRSSDDHHRSARHPRPAAWSTKNKVGLGLAIFYAVTNIPSAFVPPPTGDEAGPPMAILVVCSVLGGRRPRRRRRRLAQGSRPAARLAAASLVVVTLTSLPAFFVDVPAGIKILVAAGVVITVVFIVLIFSPAKRS